MTGNQSILGLSDWGGGGGGGGGGGVVTEIYDTSINQITFSLTHGLLDVANAQENAHIRPHTLSVMTC